MRFSLERKLKAEIFLILIRLSLFYENLFSKNQLDKDMSFVFKFALGKCFWFFCYTKLTRNLVICSILMPRPKNRKLNIMICWRILCFLKLPKWGLTMKVPFLRQILNKITSIVLLLGYIQI